MDGAELDLKQLTERDFSTQKLLVRRWLALTGLNPSTDWLGRFFSELIGAKADAQPLLELDGYQIRRFANKAYITQVAEAPQPGVLLELKPGQQSNTVVGQFILNVENKGTALLLTSDPVYLVFGLFSLPFKPAGERHKQGVKTMAEVMGYSAMATLARCLCWYKIIRWWQCLGLPLTRLKRQATAYIDWQKT